MAQGAGYLLAAAGAVALCGLIPPISEGARHAGLALGAVLGLGLVWAHGWILADPVRRRWRGRWRAALLVGLALAGGTGLRFDLRALTGIVDYTDLATRYLNVRYLDELGYDGLYAAILQADREGRPGRTAGVERVRDLRDHAIRSDREVQLQGRRIRDDRFTAVRWAAFVAETRIFLDAMPPRGIRDRLLAGHGLDRPPTWVLAASPLVAWTPAAYSPTLARLDLLLILGLLLAIARIFGPDVAGLGALWFLVGEGGEGPLPGQSLLRYDGVVALVLGACLLRGERWGAAGAALAWAAATRPYLAPFLGPPLVRIASTRWRSGRWEPAHRRFLVGAGLVAGLLLGGSLLRHGGAPWRELARATWAQGLLSDGGWVGIGLGLAAVGLVGWSLWARPRRPWEELGWPVLPLSLLAGLSLHAWMSRWLLVLWHLGALPEARGEARLHLAGLGLLFAGPALLHGAWLVQGAPTAMDPGRLAYSLGLGAWLLHRLRRPVG